jgi:hypothetical protein
LAKLNQKLFPYPWSFGKDFKMHLDDDASIPSPGFYTGPPPSVPKYSTPNIPPANVLAQRIIASLDKLFFVSHPIRSGDVREWCLVACPS